MTLPGETIYSGASPVCPDCGTVLKNEVLRPFAGYYIGTECNCGPYSRESGYFKKYRKVYEDAYRSAIGRGLTPTWARYAADSARQDAWEADNPEKAKYLHIPCPDIYYY